MKRPIAASDLARGATDVVALVPAVLESLSLCRTVQGLVV
jgi:hypothetical protein